MTSAFFRMPPGFRPSSKQQCRASGRGPPQGRGLTCLHLRLFPCLLRIVAVCSDACDIFTESECKKDFRKSGRKGYNAVRRLPSEGSGACKQKCRESKKYFFKHIRKSPLKQKIPKAYKPLGLHPASSSRYGERPPSDACPRAWVLDPSGRSSGFRFFLLPFCLPIPFTGQCLFQGFVPGYSGGTAPDFNGIPY